VSRSAPGAPLGALPNDPSRAIRSRSCPQREGSLPQSAYVGGIDSPREPLEERRPRPVWVVHDDRHRAGSGRYPTPAKLRGTILAFSRVAARDRLRERSTTRPSCVWAAEGATDSRPRGSGSRCACCGPFAPSRLGSFGAGETTVVSLRCEVGNDRLCGVVHAGGAVLTAIHVALRTPCGIHPLK
jgi:hypothetical protein